MPFGFGTTQAKEKPEDLLKAFIQGAPAANYTFDSERGSSESEICREAGLTIDQKKKCMVLKMESKRLFECMQEQGFFCALPLDPNKTYMECKPLPKS